MVGVLNDTRNVHSEHIHVSVVHGQRRHTRTCTHDIYTNMHIHTLPHSTHRPSICLSISVPPPPPRRQRPFTNNLYLFAPLRSAHAPLTLLYGKKFPSTSQHHTGVLRATLHSPTSTSVNLSAAVMMSCVSFALLLGNARMSFTRTYWPMGGSMC